MRTKEEFQTDLEKCMDEFKKNNVNDATIIARVMTLSSITDIVEVLIDIRDLLIPITVALEAKLPKKGGK